MFTGLAGRILGLCLSSHDHLCETAVEILFSMIYAEYVLEGNFDAIEREIFAKLEAIVRPPASIADIPSLLLARPQLAILR
jgi:dedicator of cytokinesis protein 3